MSGYAWVTLATNDSYSLGALVLAHSLKQVGTNHQLAVLVTPGVTNIMRKNLGEVFNVVQEVNLFDSKDEANLRLLQRPELGVTFTKLHCWRLTQFEKCVFLDADVLVLVNCDELFQRDEFSAAPDVGWPDCFNSGVFVYKPSLETYNKLVDFAVQKGSFDGGDQGLLNAFFSDWAYRDISKHLPFIYNMCSTASYSYLPAFKYYGADVKIVHFIGPAKPWLQYFNTESRKVQPSPELQHLQGVLQRWWDLFCSLIHPKLSPEMSGLAGAFAQFTLDVGRSASQEALENHLRRQAWEVGNIDYMGRDSFDNIWSKICQTLQDTSIGTQGAVSSPESQQVPETPKEDQQILPETPQTLAATGTESPKVSDATDEKSIAEIALIPQELVEPAEPAVVSTSTESVPVEEITTGEAVQIEDVVKPDVIPEPEPSPVPEIPEPESQIKSELPVIEKPESTPSDTEIKTDVPIKVDEPIKDSESVIKASAATITQPEQLPDKAVLPQEIKSEEIIPDTLTQQTEQAEAVPSSEVPPIQEVVQPKDDSKLAEVGAPSATPTDIAPEKPEEPAPPIIEEKVKAEKLVPVQSPIEASPQILEEVKVPEKLVDVTKPIDEIRPIEEIKQVEETKPAEEIKPVVVEPEPVVAATPIADIKPPEESKPSAEAVALKKLAEDTAAKTPAKTETSKKEPKKSEQPLEKTETIPIQEIPQAEASADTSAQVPKSDTKPKEVRKIKKKVKKVPKTDAPGEPEPKK